MPVCTPGHREECWYATDPRCVCACGGANHGIRAGETPVQGEVFTMEIPDLTELTQYRDIEAYYDAVPEAALSPESDYGVWWRDDDGGVWRVTYVHETGDVYAVRSPGVTSGRLRIGGVETTLVSAGEHAGPVVVLGTIDTFTEEQEEAARLRSPHRVAEPPLEAVIPGWPDRCGQQGSLGWVLSMIREHVQ